MWRTMRAERLPSRASCSIFAVRALTSANSAATKKPFSSTKKSVAPSRQATPSRSSDIDSFTGVASGEDAAAALRFGHALDAAHQRRGAEIDALRARHGPDVLRRALHQADQAVVHLLLAPEELLEALHPLEVGDRHAAGVREDVGHDGDAALAQDRVGVEPGRAVRALDDELRLDALRVLAGDLVLHRGGDQHVARQLEQRLVADRLRAGQALQLPVLGEVAIDFDEIDAARRVHAAAHVREPDQLRAVLHGDAGRRAADLAEALHHHARALHGEPDLA